MATILRLGSDPPRFAKVRFRSAARDVVLQLRGGAPLPPEIDPLEARVYVKEGTSPPLGDCPRSKDALIFSNRARQALADFTNEFDFVPVNFTEVGAEKRSGVWYNHPLSTYERRVDLEEPFYLVHANVTRMPDQDKPVQAPPFPGDAPEGGVSTRALAKWIAAAMPFMHNESECLTDYFRQSAPPEIFAFGPAAAIYFTDAFARAVKSLGLKGFTFDEVAQIAF